MLRKSGILLLICLLLLLAAGCAAGEKTAEVTAPPVNAPAEPPADLSGELERVTDHKWRFTFRSEGERWRYGEEYTLLRKTEEGFLPVVPEKELPQFDHRLYGGQEKEISVNLAYAYGELPSGDYLLQKRFLNLAAHPEDEETDWEQIPPEHFSLLELPFTLPETLPAVSRPSDPWDYHLYRGQALRKGEVAVWGEDFSSAGGTLVLENRSENEEVYGYDWTLYFREGEEWLPVPMSERPSSGLLALTLAPGEQARQELSFEPVCGLLPSGDYRLLQPLDLENGTGLQFDFTLGEDGTDPATFDHPLPLLDAVKMKAQEYLTLVDPWGNILGLRRGDEGWEEVLALLTSLRGTPCRTPREMIDRQELRLRHTEDLTLCCDGEKPCALADGLWYALEGDRPDLALTNLFEGYGFSNLLVTREIDQRNRTEEGSLTVTAEFPVYGLAEAKADFLRIEEMRANGEKVSPLDVLGAQVGLTLENHSAQDIECNEVIGLEVFQNGSWHALTDKGDWIYSLMNLHIPAGEQTNFSITLYRYQTLPPGRYRVSVNYVLGEKTPERPWENVAFAEFRLANWTLAPADHSGETEGGELTARTEAPEYSVLDRKVQVILENHTEDKIQYDGAATLEIRLDGNWHPVTHRNGTGHFHYLLATHLGPHSALSLSHSLRAYEGPLEAGTYRVCVPYTLGRSGQPVWDHVAFAEFELTEASVSSVASGEALLTVSCGGETVVPYPAFLWAETWTELGWLNADAEPLEFTVQERWEEIPVLTLEGPDELSVSPGHGVQYSGRMDVYDENVDRLFRQWEEDPAVLTALGPGTYLCALRVTVTGDYIASEDRHERTGYQCLFRLVIPDGAVQG